MGTRLREKSSVRQMSKMSKGVDINLLQLVPQADIVFCSSNYNRSSRSVSLKTMGHGPWRLGAGWWSKDPFTGVT